MNISLQIKHHTHIPSENNLTESLNEIFKNIAITMLVVSTLFKFLKR